MAQWQRSGVDVTLIIVKNESSLVYHFHGATLCLNLSTSAAVKVSAMQNAENVARKVLKMFKTGAKKTALLFLRLKRASHRSRYRQRRRFIAVYVSVPFNVKRNTLT